MCCAPRPAGDSLPGADQHVQLHQRQLANSRGSVHLKSGSSAETGTNLINLFIFNLMQKKE